MDFINKLPPLVLVFIGLLAGALIMRLLNNKDKTALAKLSTDLAVSTEKIKQLQNKEAEFRQLQQLYIETKTKNAELQTRMNEQVKNAAEKLALLKDAEGRLNTQFENLAGKIFDETTGNLPSTIKPVWIILLNPCANSLANLSSA